MKTSLTDLLCAVDFDCTRVVLADHDFEANSLTLFFEDNLNPEDRLENCVSVELDRDEVAQIVSKEYNVDGDVFEWFKEDASAFEVKYLLAFISSFLVKSVRYHGRVAA